MRGSSPERIEAPLVLDADGLNAYGGRIERARGRAAVRSSSPRMPERWVACSTGTPPRSMRSASRARARRRGAAAAIVLLKGDDSIVTDGERLAVNTVSSPQLATAGTGDVLTGVIAALIARGVEPFAATCAAVVAHSRAGRDAGERVGHDSVIAGDVIDSIPAGLAH